MPTTEAEVSTAFAPLATERLVLRPVEPGDRDQILALAGDWEVARYLTRVPFPYRAEQAEQWIAHARRSLRAGSEIALAITLREEGTMIGCVGIDLAVPRRSGALGYWLGRPYWGQGYASESCRRMLDYAFSVLNLQRLEADVLKQNRASIRVLESVGFKFDRDIEVEFPARGGMRPALRYALTRAHFGERGKPAAATEDGAAETEVPAAGKGRPLVFVVAVALVDADNRVLLAQRPDGKTMAGLWEFPGGKLHAGETPEAALIRELREELGIDTEQSCLAPVSFASHAYADFHLLMPLFVCRVWQGTPQPREGQTLAWVHPNKMADYPMPPADVPLVAALRDLL
jgi:8-oxo-dGTP diphosphatase